MGSAGRSGSGFSDSDVIRWIQKKEGGRIIETIADNGLVHAIIRSQAAYGGFYIDATMGNGRDTLMLCTLAKETGSVLAFDIQDTALEATQRLLKEQGCLGRAKLIRDGHEHMDLWCRRALQMSSALTSGIFQAGAIKSSHLGP